MPRGGSPRRGQPKRPRSAPHIARIVTRWPCGASRRGVSRGRRKPCVPLRQVGRHSGGYNAPPPGRAGKKPSTTARGTLACPALRGDFARVDELISHTRPRAWLTPGTPRAPVLTGQLERGTNIGRTPRRPNNRGDRAHLYVSSVIPGPAFQRPGMTGRQAWRGMAILTANTIC
jgi:hypothetical protein